MNINFRTATGLARTDVQCPNNMVLRILSVAIDLSIPSEGDQLIIVFNRSNEQFLRIPSPPLTTVMLGVNAAIGQSAIVNPLGSTAAGAIVFGQVLVQVSMALPDIWFAWDVGVSFDTAAGTTAAGYVLTYELKKSPKR